LMQKRHQEAIATFVIGPPADRQSRVTCHNRPRNPVL
jgi:hypothetical protein